MTLNDEQTQVEVYLLQLAPVIVFFEPRYVSVSHYTSTNTIRIRRSGSGSRSAKATFPRLKTTHRGALETAIAGRILVAAALIPALITIGTELPIAQRVLEVATRGNGTIISSSSSSSSSGVYATTTKSRDPHVRSIGVGYCCKRSEQECRS